MKKSIIKILGAVVILGGVVGGTYYFTDGVGLNNKSIVGDWCKSDNEKMTWKFFDNGTLFVGKNNLYCTYEINGDKIIIDMDPLDYLSVGMDDNARREYEYKIEGKELILKSIDGKAKDITFKRD